MENKTKQLKVYYVAIIREFEMYSRGHSLKHFCDESDYVYPNVLRYYRKCLWNSKFKLPTSVNADKSLVPLEIEPVVSANSTSPTMDSFCSEEAITPKGTSSVPYITLTA